MANCLGCLFACVLLLCSQSLFVVAGVEYMLAEPMQGDSVALSLMQKFAGVLSYDTLSAALRLDDELYMADEPNDGGSLALSLMQTHGTNAKPPTAAQRAKATSDDAQPPAPLPLTHTVSDAVASANASLEANLPDAGSPSAASELLATAAAVDAKPATSAVTALTPPLRTRFPVIQSLIIQEIAAALPSYSALAAPLSVDRTEVASAPLLSNASQQANVSELPALSIQTGAERIPESSLVEVIGHFELASPADNASVAFTSGTSSAGPSTKLADLLKGAFHESHEDFKSQGVQVAACALLLFALTWIAFWWCFGKGNRPPPQNHDDDPLGYLFKAKRVHYQRGGPAAGVQGTSRPQ